MNLLRHVCRSSARLLESHSRFAAITNARSFASAHQASVPPSVSASLDDEIKSRRERERLFVIAQQDPDRFGSQYTPGSTVRDELLPGTDDAGDLAEEAHLQNPPARSQRLRTKQYADLIKEHLRNRRIKEALDVLEVRMLKEDRVKPENYIYNLLMGECGRLGYTKKAFNLFTRMKQRGLKVTGGTYTALFNACANTPWLQDGLQKAEHLRQVMLEKGYEPNASNYNAMIKAFGRGGDLRTAFQLVDEMQTKRLPVEVQTFNFLLQACASDKELGFRHALLVWHKMLRRRMVPDVYSFNTMLRCVRDCGLGDLDTMQAVIGQILVESKSKLGVAEGVPELTANAEEKLLQIGGQDGKEDDNTNSLITVDSSIAPATIPTEDSNALNTPNLLSSRPHLGRLVALAEVHKPEDRLLLLGGSSGFLAEMDKAKASADIKTFTQLLEVLQPTNSAEKKLLATLKKEKIKVDIDFFNVLMKKRSMRFDYEAAKEVIALIETADLRPDIVTYGVLALSCKTPDEADELMQEMLNKGLRINIQILGAMLRQGCAQHNFEYVLKIMDLVYTERIKPNEQFIMHLVKFRTNCYEFRTKNKGYAQTKQFRTEFNNFCAELELWRKKMGLDDITLKEQIEAVREHPWEQFKYAQPEGVEELKNPKSRLQPKLRRHIQRIKPEQMRDDRGDGRKGKFVKPKQLQ